MVRRGWTCSTAVCSFLATRTQLGWAAADRLCNTFPFIGRPRQELLREAAPL